MTASLNQKVSRKCISACLVILLSAPMAAVAQQGQQSPPQQTSAAAAEQAAITLPQAPEPAPAQAAGGDQQSSPQQQGAQNPLGTAAAPYGTPTGVAGSRPSGAAIAPGKQKRVHAWLIRYTIIIAAAAATGAVIALSKGSPSRPQ